MASKKNCKSDLWLHFIKNDSGGKCKYCLMNVKTSGNTTNLRNHLMRRHQNLYDVSAVPKNPKKNEKSGGDGDQQMHVCDL